MFSQKLTITLTYSDGEIKHMEIYEEAADMFPVGTELVTTDGTGRIATVTKVEAI